MKKSSKKSGGGMKASRSSGSPRHTEMIGAGPVAGAEEQDRKGPGSAAETRRGLSGYDSIGDQGSAKGKGKVPNHTRGDEEDGE